jgi:hypothetical protein
MLEPEAGILADRQALARAEQAAAEATHPLAKAAHEADARYLRSLVDKFEASFFIAHGL